MKSKIKFGIIGCSSIAKKSAIPSIIMGNNSTLESIGSRTIQKSKKIAKEFSCSNFGTYDEILENDNIDAVYISLPMSLHEKWVIKAARSGKHILCEKSTSLSYDSAKKIIRECKKNDVLIKENFTFKLHPQHKKILGNGDLTNCDVFVDFSWMQFTDLSTHFSHFQKSEMEFH